jgi:hypothetical protein
MIPSLQQVAASLVKLCMNDDVFNPTMLRRIVGVNFPHTEPANLSAQIQPHLRALRQAGAVRLITTHQKRNRPYRVINRDVLLEISKDENYHIPIQIQNPIAAIGGQDEDVEDSEEQSTVSKDDTTNLIIDMERRLIALEETVEMLVAKLNAVGTVLRP